MRPLRRFTVLSTLPERLKPLDTLARNLRWTWHAPTRDLFASIDAERWEAADGSPLRLLRSLSADRLEALTADEQFLGRLDAAAADLQAYLDAPTWYQGLEDGPKTVAYFSPEFGITEAMPQYSGGLGVLAGDHLKSASDLGLPLVGVGLFYKMGYFRQLISADGRQEEEYPVFDPNELPLEPVLDEHGSPALVKLRMPGSPLRARIWRARVGRIQLILLDSDVEGNTPEHRGITDRLYGGGTENRLRQEILLGIGGVRALAICGVKAEVFHTNEGHAGFLGLERIRRLVEDDQLDLDTAIETVRGGTVFTTHTPVPAGIDRFGRDLIERYFGHDGVPTAMSVERLMRLGADPEHEGTFNMAVMGLRLAQRSNGVSALHGQVSRGMFAALWPGFDQREVPIGHITNGVHVGSWVSRGWQELYERTLGDGYANVDTDWTPVQKVPAKQLWELRNEGRHAFIEDVRERMRAAWERRGVGRGQLGWLDTAFDPDALTIGFARRVPSYKRLTLILKERDRLKKLLTDQERPVQLVLAGKAHPHDEGGKALIREFGEFASDPEVRRRIVFLPDYDMAMARHLVAGSDVWLNNPLRPYEACGTSGMKASLNGCLNLSIRDGWWDELYDGANGWAIPSLDGGNVDQEERDSFEASAILDLLEQQVVPLFYDRGKNGVPTGWVEKIKHNIVSLGPSITATRMVRDYTTELYVPSAKASRRLLADDYAAARVQVAWKDRVAKQWHEVRVQGVDGPEGDGQPFGQDTTLVATVGLGSLEPGDVRVEATIGRLDITGQIVNNGLALGNVPDGTKLDIKTGSNGYVKIRVLPVNTMILVR